MISYFNNKIPHLLDKYFYGNFKEQIKHSLDCEVISIDSTMF
jgi:hypothetical protein